MQPLNKCQCKYQNPLEYICTLANCNSRRVICQSCAWDHRAHERCVKPLIQWKEEMTNDCVIQRLTHIKNNQTQMQCLDQFTKLAQGEVVLALRGKCDQIQLKLKATGMPLENTLESIKSVTQGDYSNKPVMALIKEFPNSSVQERLDELEIEACKRTQQSCQQILQLMEKVQEILDFCDHRPSAELKKLQQQMEELVKRTQQPRKRHIAAQSVHIAEEEKDDKINDFLQKLQNPPVNYKVEARPRPSINLSQSSLNYMRFGEDVLKSERQSFYVSQQRPDLWNDDLGSSRQQIQPLSTKSNPYNNVMLQKKQGDQVGPIQQIIQKDPSQVPIHHTYLQQRLGQRPSLQQFYLSKLSNARKDGEGNDLLSKSFYEFSQRK